MKKHYRFENLGCANCAAKMETAIGKLAGVNSVTVNFMAQKLTLDAEDTQLETILQQVAAICKKIEPHCALQV